MLEKRNLRYVRLSLCLLSLIFSTTFCGITSSRRHGFRTARPASVGEAVDEALRGTNFPPPDWLRLSAMADTEEKAQGVRRAVLAISEGLQVEECNVERMKHGISGEIEVVKVQVLGLWVPPRSMLLVSSMIGEALGPGAPILVENLEDDSEDDSGSASAEFFLGKVEGGGSPEDLRTLGLQLLEQRWVAEVHVEDTVPSLTLQTTAKGMVKVEEAVKTGEIHVKWSAVGGNAEALEWIAKEVG